MYVTKKYNIQIKYVLCSLSLELPKNIRAFPKECVLRTINFEMKNVSSHFHPDYPLYSDYMK